MPTAVSPAEPFSREIPPDDIGYQVREFHVLQMLHYMLGHIWIDPIIASCKRFTYTKTLRE